MRVYIHTYFLYTQKRGKNTKGMVYSDFLGGMGLELEEKSILLLIFTIIWTDGTFHHIHGLPLFLKC